MLVYIQEPLKPVRNKDGTITNSQLEQWLRDYQASLKQCNINIEALRKWAEIEDEK